MRGSSSTSRSNKSREEAYPRPEAAEVPPRRTQMVVQDEWHAVHALLLSIVESKKSSSCSDKVWRCCSSTGSGG